MHSALYALLASPAPIFLLEAQRVLPPESGRLMSAFSFVMSFFLWNAHASAKTDLAEAQTHELLAFLTLAHGSVIVFSVCHPNNLVAYIASQAMYLATGMWMFTAGMELGVEQVAPFFAMQTTALTMVIVFVGSFCGRPPIETTEAAYLDEFEVLKLTEEGKE